MMNRFVPQFLTFLFFIWACFFSFSLSAQDSYPVDGIPSYKVNNARNNARTTVVWFVNLLNSISTYEDRLTVNSFIAGAVDKGSKQLFTNTKPCIVSDLNPNITEYSSLPINPTHDSARTYLNDFDFFYSKYEDPTILYSNILVSDLLTNNEGELFLWAKYKSLFKGKHREFQNKAYSETERVVRIVVDTTDKWKYLIDYVTFYSPIVTSARFRSVETDREVRERQKQQIKKAQKFESIFEYEKALQNFQLADEIRSENEDIIQSIQRLTRILDGKTERKYFGIEAYSNKIKDNPNDPDLYYERALKFIIQANTEAAKKDLAEALKLSGKKFKKAFDTLGDILGETQPEQAIVNYKSALDLDEDDDEIRKKLIGLQESRYRKEALDNIGILLAKGRDATLFFKAGRIYQKLNKNEEAIRNFKDVILEDKQYADAYFYLGKSYLNTSEIEKADENFFIANQIKPLEYNPKVISDNFAQKVKQWRSDEADDLASFAEEKSKIWSDKLLERAEEARPEEEEEINTLAKDFILETIEEELCEGNYNEALIQIEKLRDFNIPGNLKSYLEALTYFELGEGNTTKELIEVCVKNKVKGQENLTADLYVLSGYMELQEEHYQDAATEFDKALKIDDNHAEANYALYRWYLENGETDKSGKLKRKDKEQADMHLAKAKQYKPALIENRMDFANSPVKSFVSCY